MKFLCIPCDEPMQLEKALGPDNGSMSIVYQCPSCRLEIAMLTNRMETQMVRSLGVKIGGRTDEPEPMEMLRSSLATGSSQAEPVTGSKCPFTGVVAAADSMAGAPSWTAEAEARMAAIPAFVRTSVRKQIEEFARQHGHAVIDTKVLDEVRGRLGM